MASVDEADLADLISRMDEAADAYIRGDVRRYYPLFEHGTGYTLMPPHGGEAVHVQAPTEEQLDETSRFFAAGEARLDVAASYASGDLVVLVAVERQHGEVSGTPDQDWSLRVTLVFRRSAGAWQLVHRHADPLVHPVPFEHLGRLARGLQG
jgi:ketosteroid isomerase-like protein